MKYLAIASILLLSACSTHHQQNAPKSYSEQTQDMLTHVVFFDLKDESAASTEELINACYKYLAPHDGIVFFSAGPRVVEKQRDVNDLDFEVALTVIFKDVESHDAYQESEIHKEFIKLYSHNWDKVRVFDGAASSANQPS